MSDYPKSNLLGATDGKALLKELEALMLFDQSSSSKWPRVTVYIESSGAVEADNDSALMVYPNGRPYNLERAADVAVPPEVIDALQAALTARMVKSKDSGSGYASKDVMRFPFRVLDAKSQRRYDKWKEALEVLRYTVTETKKKRHPTLDKDVYETISRYVPEEKIEKAREVMAWVKIEIDSEKIEADEIKREAA